MTRTWGWALLASIAVVWPSRLVAPIDGAPFDTIPEAVLLGVVLPLALILHPAAFRAAVPRRLVLALAAWKIGTWALLTQQGLCATFAVATPLPDHFVLRRSWDARVPLASPLPSCSAILTRDLQSKAAFPAWFLNLPVGTDRHLESGRGVGVEHPPSAPVLMHVAGFAPEAGSVAPYEASQLLQGEHWRFAMPAGASSAWRATAWIDPPTRTDRVFASFWFITPAVTAALVGFCGWHAVRRFRLTASVAAALGVLATAGGVAGWLGEPYSRAFVLALGTTVLLWYPRRLQTVRGALLVIGVPLLSMIAVAGLPATGHFTLYSAGDDWQTFQRFAARVFFEGFWLEGGERTFWQQPLYRWVVGLLHMLFGDSSVGERYLDGFGLLALSALAYVMVRQVGSHRLALTAAVATLATTLLGPNWYLVGRGLSEMSAMMWLSLAACALLRARTGRAAYAVLAGACAILAVYTRLNYLVIAVGLMLLLAPTARADAWTPLRQLTRSVSLRAGAIYLGMLAFGMAMFAARTWYYTGHFSVLYGTTRAFNSTGLSTSTIRDVEVWRQVVDSVLIVVTVADPPRLDPRSALVPLGVVIALLAVARVPVCRAVPLAPAALSLLAIAGAVFVRGLAYPGRFSLHLIPFAVSTCVIFAALLVRAPARHRHLL
jgi:hypothetical protein